METNSILAERVISVKSQLRQDTHGRIKLPGKVEPDQVKARLPKRILLVDDEKSSKGSLDLILSDAGFEVLTAESLAESIRILRNVSVDLVITDLRSEERRVGKECRSWWSL